MISEEFAGNKRAYAYVGGMLNQVWLAGIVGKVYSKEKPISFDLMQVENENLAIRVYLKKGDYLPADVRPGMPVKVDGHISGRVNPDTKEREAYLQAINVSRPTLLDMPGELAWQASIDGVKGRNWPQGAKITDVKPALADPNTDEATEEMAKKAIDGIETQFTGPVNLFQIASGNEGDDVKIFRDRLKLRKAANVVRVAGIVQAFFMALDSSGKREDDTLMVLLRQSGGEDSCIPVRVYGKAARDFHKAIKRGVPVYFIGRYETRVKVKKSAEIAGEVDEIITYPYVRANSIRTATQFEITKVPEWAVDLARQMSAARFQNEANATRPEEVTAPEANDKVVTNISRRREAPKEEDIASDIAGMN